VFLLGLGIGSSIGSAIAARTARPREALGWCQLSLCAGVLWTATMLSRSLPYWPIDVQISTAPWLKLQLDLVRCLWAVLPPAILWGASFPLALAAVVSRGQDPGRVVGSVYAANTVGAIAGSLSASLLLVAWIGSQHAQQLLIALSAASALLMLIPVRAALSVVLAGGLLAVIVPPVPDVLVAYGRFVPTRGKNSEVIYMDEGLTASVAVSRGPGETLNYHNAGKIQASSDPADMRLQRMLGHLTTLMAENPRSFLVIGCGAGVTAGAVSIEPKAERVVIAELEPLVPEVVSTYFSEHNFDVIRNPKVQIRIDDGRHFLLTTKQKFDGITSDPFDPWVKGAAALYTKEFFEAAKAHLNPGGVITVFVQLYESSEATVKSEIATFLEVFPNGTVWANTISGQGYDVVLLGQAEPAQINVDRIDQKLRSPEYARIAESLGQIGFYSAIDLFSTYAGNKHDMAEWLKDAAINRDRNLRLQYLAGMGLNLVQANDIYVNMIANSRFPENLFTGSERFMQDLRSRLQLTLRY
jgi:spermidine synthase